MREICGLTTGCTLGGQIDQKAAMDVRFWAHVNHKHHVHKRNVHLPGGLFGRAGAELAEPVLKWQSLC